MLLPDRIRDTDPAEVVRERGAPQKRDRVGREAHPPGSRFGEVGNGRRVLTEPRRLEPGDRRDRGECGVDPVTGDPLQRGRLAVHRLRPHVRVVELGKEVVEVPRGELGESRIVRCARATLDDRPRLVCARGGEEEGDVPRHVQQAHRQGDRVARDVGDSPSVPACEDVLERRLDVRAEAEPAREPLRHLAHHRERVPGPRAGVGEGIFDQLGPHLRAAAGPDVGVVEGKDLVAVGGVDQVEGGSVVDVVAVQLRRLVSVRRAPGGVEEGDVVGVRELLARRSGEFAETDREHGGAERVLDRLPGAEVRGDRECADNLGGADRALTGRHPPLRPRRDQSTSHRQSIRASPARVISAAGSSGSARHSATTFM
jgi:hypothetical protein